MKSIRTKITLLTIIAIIISLTCATFFGVFMIRRLGKSNSEEMLKLLCETGEKNIDFYFESVESSVEIVSKYVQEDLSKTELDDLDEHITRAKSIFEKTAPSTNGLLTYYYRVEPDVSETIDGFWFIKNNDGGFDEHEVTDISQYDMDDTTKLVWYTVPRKTGKSIWLPPYITENLGVKVLSYNVPIYRNGVFFGVVGIEMDYELLATLVNNIKLFKSGYAFINDSEGNIICHPYIDVTTETMPKVPDGLLSENNFVFYKFDGVKKEAVWLNLSNGMRLNVTVPVSEINGNWKTLLLVMIGVSAVLLVVFILLTLKMTGPITKPIKELSEGAIQVNNGNYDVKLDYHNNDEIGVLTNTFNNLISHLKDYISELSSLAYDDALTSVHNKGAFDTNIHDLQEAMLKDNNIEFAIAILDCDKLKAVNDQYGHKRGDIYLKTASNLMCLVFANSQVFRIGGDEFAVIIQNEDYKQCDKLIKVFEIKSEEINKAAQNKWSEVHASIGLAKYDKDKDKTVDDVINRADKLMYEYKRRKFSSQ